MSYKETDFENHLLFELCYEKKNYLRKNNSSRTCILKSHTCRYSTKENGALGAEHSSNRADLRYPWLSGFGEVTVKYIKHHTKQLKLKNSHFNICNN